MRPRNPAPHFTESARKRLAKSMNCAVDEVATRMRRMDERERVSDLSTAIVDAIQEESERIQGEIDRGAPIPDQEVENRLLAAWCIGRIKASVPVDEESETVEVAQEQTPATLAGTDAEQVTSGFDVSSVVDEINNAVKAEMANIEREISEGADISDIEIQIRLKGALSRLG